jgi:hypothetical protein
VGRVQAERAWAEQPGRPRSAVVGRARAWAGLRAKIQATYCAKLFFFFLFYAIFAGCLKLCDKLCANPKMMQIFV